MINVPAYLDTPYYENKAVQLLQQEFSVNLSWLDKCFAIATKGIDDEGRGYPSIYDPTTGLNADLRPSVDVNSYCFFEIESPTEIRDDSEGENYDTYYLSVTFWVNLSNVFPSRDYDYTSELYEEAIEILQKSNSNRNYAKNIKLYTQPDEVYSKYSALQEKHKQFLMRPYSYFKLSFTLNIDGKC